MHSRSGCANSKTAEHNAEHNKVSIGPRTKAYTFANPLQYSRMDREVMDFFQGLFDSLRCEMHQEFAGVKARLDRMEASQDRQGDLPEGGSRAMTRVIEWTEGRTQ